MLKRFTVLFLGFLLVSSISFAQDRTQVFSKSKPAIEKDVEVTSGEFTKSATLADVVLIGKAWNAYTTQASFTNQLYYDPYSNLMAFIKRNDATGAGSGRIVYQVSDDMGQNWTGQIGPLNEPFGYVLGRHPNVVISNPTKTGENFEDICVVGSWPELSASWYYYAFMGDVVAEGNPNFYADSTYYPGDEMFVNSKGDVFGVVGLVDYDTTGTGVVNNHLFKTTDCGETWTKEPISYVEDFNEDTWNGTKGDISEAGLGYVIMQGQEANGPNLGAYDFAWKKTTDDGETFDENWTWVHYWDAEYNGGTLGDSVTALNYEIDFITYGDDSPIFAGTFVDTVDGTATGVYALYNLGDGWKADLISLVNATSQTLPGDLSTLNEVELARSENGKVVALKYADFPTLESEGYDLFVSWFDGETWTDPYNYTESVDMNEVYSQAAPRLADLGNDQYQLISLYTEFGVDATSGELSDLAEASFYFVDNVIEQVVTSVEGAETVVTNYSLEQNYPNPFNPTTTIEYTLTEKNFVSLKVYDVLGKEVATLVNGIQESGVNEITFDASDLASGMYIYKLEAGNFSSAKKMMLLK